MFKAWIILGTNMGDKSQNLENSIQMLAHETGKIGIKSSIYESDSWGYDDTNYYNQVLEIDTLFSPTELLENVLEIEKKMGRTRKTGHVYEARIIDIDILFYEDITIETNHLVIPHPKIADRKFVLMPLCEIIPNYIHPILKVSILEMLSATSDKLKVKKIK